MSDARNDDGRRASADEAVELVYARMHEIAERAMGGERADHTLQPTALVHEVWLRLQGGPGGAGLDRGAYLALASRTARRVLVDHARRHAALRRGGGAMQVTLSAAPGEEAPLLDLLALDEALDELASRSERQARVVELHWFGGLSFAEVGEQLDVTDRTAKSDWRFARAWLLRRLAGEDAEEAGG